MADPSDTAAATRRLIEALIARGPIIGLIAGPEPVRLIETHISWVILTGDFAYKIKKPVNLGFVDFSTLESRHQACLEELRLNRRLTPDLYPGLLTIRGTPQHPLLDGAGPVIEYAVQMRQFPPGSVLSGDAAREITVSELEALADLIARFHAGLLPAPPTSRWGSPAQILAPAIASLDHLDTLLVGLHEQPMLDGARRFLLREFECSATLMQNRLESGFVRECHGDLHLGNLARIGGRIVPFDALEFDPALRWIDVLNEVAFLVMDLEVNGGGHAGFRFLNHYLDVTGDHEGLPVLPFYLSYRAVVRAKVTALGPAADDALSRQRIAALLRYAAGPLEDIPPLLILMVGVSGSGKSHLARQLAAANPAIHLRSDIERKRLFGLQALQRTRAEIGSGIYAPEASERTCAHLATLAATALQARFPVIVDATHLTRASRAPLLALARNAGIASVLLVCRCNFTTIARRLELRSARGSDPSEAGIDVVTRQLEYLEAPENDEADLVVNVDTDTDQPIDGVMCRLYRR